MKRPGPIPRWSALVVAFTFALVLSASVLMLGCSAEPSAPSAELALPEPNLQPLEPAVRLAIEEARSALERQRQDDPSDAELSDAYGELAKLYLAHLLLEPAEAAFLNAEALAPAQFRWPYYLGCVYRMRNQPAAARESFERALSIEPGDAPTSIALGELLLAEDRPDDAESHFRRALDADASSSAALVGLGKAAASRGDFAQAIERFEGALVIQPEADAIHYPLGMAHRALGDIERARWHLAQSGERAASQPDRLMAEVRALATGSRSHLLRAGQALEAGRIQEGRDALRLAIAADPNDATARVTLGAILAQQGDRDAAKEQFVAALGIDPGYAKAHYNLGLTLAQEGDDPQAIEHYRQAIESDPRHERALSQLAAASLRLGLDRQAVEVYDRLIELEPGSEPARLRPVLILIRMGADSEARTRLEDALAQLPEAHALSHALARLLATSPDGAVRDGRRALALATEAATDGELLEGSVSFENGQTLAMAYAELGRFDRAVALQRALLAAAERDRQTDRLPWLRENLSRFQDGQPCRVSWPADDPIFGLLTGSTDGP